MLSIITATLAMFLLGAVYAYGVLLPALMIFFEWERSTAALPHAVLLFVYAVGMGIGGMVQDRSSPTIGAIAGGLLFGAGIWLAGTLQNQLGLVIGYGLLGGLGFGFTYVAAVTAAMRVYPHRRGLAAGIVVGAFGLGAFVWAPLAQAALPALEWHGIMRAFGLTVAIALPVLGLGIRVPRRTDATARPLAGGLTLADALRTRLFWIIFAAYTLVTAVGLLLLAHLVNFGIGLGISPAQAAWLLSLTAVGSGLGRFGMGWLSDRLGRLPCLAAASALEVVLLIGLAWVAAPTALFLLAAATGIAFGTWLALYGPTATDFFGLRYAGAIYGALYFSYGIGGLLGPMLGGALADAYDSYRPVFLISAVLCAVATLLFLTAMRLTPPEHPHPPALEEEFPT